MDDYLEAFAGCSDFEDRERLFKNACDKENLDRKLFSKQRDSWDVVELEERKLLEVFTEDNAVHRGFMGVEHNVGPLMFPQEDKRIKLVGTFEEFEDQFLRLFGSNMLQYLNWDNVIVAGGSVTSTLMQVPEKFEHSRMDKSEYFRSGSSDIDLFLYGLTETEANSKLVEIYDALCMACPFEVVCFRSAHAVTMVSQYPFRHVQVVLRLYSSPYEVLAGFDVDACTFAFDGKQVFTTPRGHHAIVCGYNTVDMSRRSPSYEMRLAKYAERGFSVHVPNWNPDKVDPCIFDKPWSFLNGLAKLVLLEKINTPQGWIDYQNRQRLKCNLPRLSYKQRRVIETRGIGGSADLSDYTTVFLPWGRGVTAKSVLSLMKKKDKMLNGKWFAKDRTYYLHPCFFGTAQEILGDCSPDDPPIPDDVPEEELRRYVRGPLTWLQDDPGRQQIGSFNPITTGDWENGAYFLESTAELFLAVNSNLDSLPAVSDPYVRDIFGRSPLHVGIMAGADRAVGALLSQPELAVMVTLRLPDGRNALHLCAQYNCPDMAKQCIDALEEEKVSQVVGLQTKDMSPVHYAILLGNVAVAKVLIEHGQADPTSIIKGFEIPGRNSGGLPALLLLPTSLETKRRQEFIRYLLSKYDKDPGTVSAMDTMLHLCAIIGDVQLAEELVAVYPQWIRALSTDLELPIALALKHCHLELAALLFQHSGVILPSEEICAASRVVANKIASATKYSYQYSALVTVTPSKITSPLMTTVENIVKLIFTNGPDEAALQAARTGRHRFYNRGNGKCFEDSKYHDLMERQISVLSWLLDDKGLDVDREEPFEAYCFGDINVYDYQDQPKNVTVIGILSKMRQNVQEMFPPFGVEEVSQSPAQETYGPRTINDKREHGKDYFKTIRLIYNRLALLVNGLSSPEILTELLVPYSKIIDDSPQVGLFGKPTEDKDTEERSFSIWDGSRWGDDAKLSQEQCEVASNIFRLAWQGDKDSFLEYLGAQQFDFPLFNVLDFNGMSLIAVAYTGRSPNIDIIRAIIEHGKKDYRAPPATKKSHKRLNNYDLEDMGSTDEEGSDEDEDEEDGEEEKVQEALKRKPNESSVELSKVINRTFTTATENPFSDEKTESVTLFHLSMIRNDLEMIELLRPLGALIHSKQALLYAVALDHVEIVRMLLLNNLMWREVASAVGIAEEQEDKYKGLSSSLEKKRTYCRKRYPPMTLLEHAMYYGSEKTVKWALSTEILEQFREVVSQDKVLGKISKHLGSEEKLIALCIRGSESMHHQNALHKTPVFYAIQGKQHGLLQRLDAWDPNLPCSNDSPPILAAIEFQCDEIFALLLENGANPLVCDDNGNNSLQLAVTKFGKDFATKIAKILYNHCDEAQMTQLFLHNNNEGITSFMSVCSTGDNVFLQELFTSLSLSAKQQLATASDSAGNTALHRAAAEQDIAKTILELTDHLHQENCSGDTPVDISLKQPLECYGKVNKPFFAKAYTTSPQTRRERESAPFTKVLQYAHHKYDNKKYTSNPCAADSRPYPASSLRW